MRQSHDPEPDCVYRDNAHLVKAELRDDGEIWLVTMPGRVCEWRILAGKAFIKSGRHWMLDEKLDVSRLRSVRENNDC